MTPYFYGNWKKRYDRLIAQGMCGNDAANQVMLEQEHADNRLIVKKLEEENKALRSTIKQLCLYGTK